MHRKRRKSHQAKMQTKSHLRIGQKLTIIRGDSWKSERNRQDGVSTWLIELTSEEYLQLSFSYCLLKHVTQCFGFCFCFVSFVFLSCCFVWRTFHYFCLPTAGTCWLHSCVLWFNMSPWTSSHFLWWSYTEKGASIFAFLILFPFVCLSYAPSLTWLRIGSLVLTTEQFNVFFNLLVLQ